MIDLTKYVKNQEDLKFLEDIRTELEDLHSSVNLICGGFGFQLDPFCDGVEVWHKGQKLGKYKSVDDLFFNFLLDGKPFIEKVSELDYE